MSGPTMTGASELSGAGWTAFTLATPPLIAPARQFVFPQTIAGEEEALARGALWIDVRVPASGSWLAQCSLGFAGRGVAHGLWELPETNRFLACAGGYGYVIEPGAPQSSLLLPARPVVAVLALAEQSVLVCHHTLLVRQRGGELWSSPRLSWEGVTISSVQDDVVHGSGWDMLSDTEIPFSVDLRRRTATGGGYHPPQSAVERTRR